MRIAIIGQAPFGAAVYEKLRENSHEIVGVFTPPEREGGRQDPLAEVARRDKTTLIQPRRWQRKGEIDETVIAQYEATNPDLNVMAFVTQIIPQRVLDFPVHTTIQYHPSLLPKHRGRSAINHALLEGDAETGLTIFWVDSGLDTGPILLQKSFPIAENDTVNSLYRDHLFPLGVEALAEAVELIAAGDAPRIVQNEDDASYEGPWEKDIARIDWSRSAASQHNFIRGSDRQPGAWTTHNMLPLRLYGSSLARAGSGPEGSIAVVSESGIIIRCGDGGAIEVDTVQVQDGKRVPAQEWAAQVGVDSGAQLE